MNRMLRLLKHRWHDEGDARRALEDAALTRLETLVRQSEAAHTGEIRLVVEPGRRGSGRRSPPCRWPASAPLRCCCYPLGQRRTIW